MAECIPIKGQIRRVCIGDLDRLITLQTRNLTASLTATDASELFVDTPGNVFAMIKTVSGETFFDDVGTERDVTHHFYIYFDETITSEIWILFNNERFDVLSSEDLDERHEFMLLRATNRGVSTQVATDA